MGTVVDNTVTRRKLRGGTEMNEAMSDFYLVSQSVRQGTVSPSHFRILVNEHPKLQNAQSIQNITYKLTHMYKFKLNIVLYFDLYLFFLYYILGIIIGLVKSEYQLYVNMLIN